jgi:hypothetical protein
MPESDVKKPAVNLAVATALYFGSLGILLPGAMAQTVSAATYEYIDIRWDGTDRMCIVYPDGRVDFIGKDLEKVSRPDDANKRAFYMTLAVNKMATQGYEVVAMISDEILMRRRSLH